MSFLCVRRFLPAIIETGAFSCVTRVPACRPTSLCLSLRLSSTGTQEQDNNVVNPNFVNRNPRNLEQMGIAKKRKGWDLQHPTKEYYHRLIFEKSSRKISGKVEHSSGKVIVSASTREMAISRHLYSLTDVAAAANVGRILAQRCLESGITCMISQPPEQGEKGAKFQSFLAAIQEGGVELEEPKEVVPDYDPGIDYDDKYVVEDLERRRKLVAIPSKMKDYGKSRRPHP